MMTIIGLKYNRWQTICDTYVACDEANCKHRNTWKRLNSQQVTASATM